jgi:flagellar motor switch protein FliN/FliY
MTDEIQDVRFGGIRDTGADADNLDESTGRRNLEMLYDIPLHVTVRLGQTHLTLKDLLSLGPGAVVELERLAGESIDLLVNGVLVGKGDVVVVNENFGLRITDIVTPEDRIKAV